MIIKRGDKTIHRFGYKYPEDDDLVPNEERIDSCHVTEACTQSVPPLVEVEPGHFVACHRQNLTNKLEKGEGLKDE